MILDSQFETKKADVDTHFRLLTFVCGVESHRHLPIVDPTSNRELYVDLEMQCCMKAQTIVILYNMVESIICECLNFIYDAVADEELTYSELTDELRGMWTNSLKRANKPEKDLEEAAKMKIKVVFDSLSVSVSGSVDMRKIFKIFEGHGCAIPIEKRYECADSFLTVKRQRNFLAHGNISFLQCGSNYLFADVEKMRKDITTFLQVVIEATKQFVKDKKYKRN